MSKDVMYSLWKDAASQKLATYLRRLAEDYFKELYEFSYGVSSYGEELWIMKGTERIALLIIAEKENRQRQINRLEEGYSRFIELTSDVT